MFTETLCDDPLLSPKRTVHMFKYGTSGSMTDQRTIPTNMRAEEKYGSSNDAV
jgi:hypothetical protein